MANNPNFPGTSSPHPMYGLRPGYNISDLPASYTPEVVLFQNVTGAQQSAPIEIGARYIQVIPYFTDVTTTFNVDLYSVVNGNSTLLLSKPSAANQGAINFGNYEGINLQGQPFSIGISNVVNPNNSTYSINYKVNG